MSREFAQLDAWLEGYLLQASPQQIRQLATRTAQAMRRQNQARITAQQNPDGSGYQPRSAASVAIRSRRGKIRRAMFAKLRQAAHLQARGSAGEATVRFTGSAGRIARVHHYGLRDQVNQRLSVQYPRRQLLGITDQDEALLAEMLADHMESFR